MRDNDFNFLPFIISFLTKISVIIRCDNVRSVFKYIFIYFTNICCIPSTERVPGDTTVSKRIKQEHGLLGASRLAGKIDTE